MLGAHQGCPPLGHPHPAGAWARAGEKRSPWHFLRSGKAHRTSAEKLRRLCSCLPQCASHGSWSACHTKASAMPNACAATTCRQPGPAIAPLALELAKLTSTSIELMLWVGVACAMSRGSACLHRGHRRRPGVRRRGRCMKTSALCPFCSPGNREPLSVRAAAAGRNRPPTWVPQV